MSENSADAEPKRRWLRPAGCIAALAVLAVVGTWFVGALRDAREAPRSAECESHLNQMNLAFRNYHDAYGCFPPAFIADADGKPMHSWRVLILPFIDQKSMYEEYRFDEPWNGPHNSGLAEQIVQMFHCPNAPPGEQFTNYVVVVGPDTAFPGDRSTSLSDFTDGQENTILMAEIANSGIHWMEPRDLNADTMSFVINDPSRPSISGPHPNGPAVTFVDHIHTYRIDSSVRPDTLRALTTIAGGERVSKDLLNQTAKARGIGAELAE